MADIFSWWPLTIGLMYLVVCAYFQCASDRVPNAVTGIAFLAGIIVSGCVESGLIAGAGGFASSIAAGAIGFAALIAFYVLGFLGAACVKSNAVFGIWIGCVFPIGVAAYVVIASSIASIAVTGIGCWIWTKSEENKEKLFPAQLTLSVATILTVLLSVSSMA